MKTNKKITLGFYFAIFLILLIGLANLYSMNKFNENRIMKEEIKDFSHVLDHLIREFSLLIHADNLEDYNKIKSEIEFEKTEREILYKRINPTLDKFNEKEGFATDIDEFENISNSLLEIHKETLDKDQEFFQKAKLEKSLRYEFVDLANELNNVELINNIWEMRYYSKEALFQYKDEEHIDYWFDSIGQIKEVINILALQEGKKQNLLDSINSYQIVALDMSNIVTRQNEIQNKEYLKIQELRDISHKIDEDEKNISEAIKMQDESLARKTFWAILIITAVGIISLILFQRYSFDSKNQYFNRRQR